MDDKFVSKFLKNSFVTSFATFSTLIMHFLSISIMSRYVPQEILGLYFLIVAIATAAKILASLGLDLSLVQFLSSEQGETQKQAFAAVIWARIVSVLGLGILLYMGASWLLLPFDAGLVAYEWHLILLFALMSIKELFFYVLQGLHQFRHYALVQAISAILRFVLIVIFRDSLSLDNLIYIDFASLGISLLVAFVFVPFRQLSPARFMFQREIIPQLLHYGFPLYSNSVMKHISDFGGTYIVGIFLSPLSIAAYEIAKKIPDGFRRLFSSFHTVYFPNLSTLFARKDYKNAEKLLNRSLVYLAVGAFALTLFSIVFSRELILLLASEEYLEAEPTFVLVMFASCLQLLATTMGYSLVSAGHPSYSTRVNIVAMGLEFALSLLFVPYMGYLGIGLSYVVMSLLSIIACYYYLRSAHIHIELSMYLRPFLILGVCCLLYAIPGDLGFGYKIFILLLYPLLSLAFIPACRQAVRMFWNFAQARAIHPKSV